ncbi:MAG: M23 family metallopeptidase, partial [Thermoleophilaceae bacterium]
MARMLAIATAVLLLLPSDAVAGGWTWPVRGSVVAAYDYRGATPYSGGQHRGIDIAAAPGTPVVAAAAGTVRFVGTAGSSGLTASIRTADGRHDTSYLHLSSVAVGGGEAVAAGERIGSAGTSGSPSSSTPHLHFGVRLAGSRHAYRDPLSLLAPPTAFRDGPRGVPVAVPAPIRVAPGRAPAPRPAPAARRAPWRVPRLGVAPAPEPR